MKFTLKNCTSVLLAVVGGVVFLVASAQGAEKERITVTISPVVQEQMQKMSPRERKKVEAAVRAGNRFIPFYFDGSANDLTFEDSIKAWRKNIRPLVNKDFIKWGEMLSEKQSGVELEIAERELSSDAFVCPQIELTGFQISPKIIDLNYRAKVAGIIKFKRGSAHYMEKLILNQQLDFQEALIGVDINNKIDYVAEKYLGLFVTPDFYVEGFNTSIEFAKHRFNATNQVEQMRIKEEIQHYQESIMQIKEQEKAVCKTTN